MENGDYIIFADESGDYGLINIDNQFLVFVLVFCIIKIDDYINLVTSKFQKLKFYIS